MLIKTCRSRNLPIYNPRMAKASLRLNAIQDCMRMVEATEACPSHLIPPLSFIKGAQKQFFIFERPYDLLTLYSRKIFFPVK
jgi:nucleotidyltransferase/DNA polymerase involved in DNA repair